MALCCLQVFKYVLQYLRARRDSKAFSLPNSLSPDIAAAVTDEAGFLGLPELQTYSLRHTGEYEYKMTSHNVHHDENRWTKVSGVSSYSIVVNPGWELVSHCFAPNSTDWLYVTSRRLKPLCNE